MNPSTYKLKSYPTAKAILQWNNMQKCTSSSENSFQNVINVSQRSLTEVRMSMSERRIKRGRETKEALTPELVANLVAQEMLTANLKWTKVISGSYNL